ncbi:MAG: RNA polymerase sigma factor [Pseudomonadota bacterium]
MTKDPPHWPLIAELLPELRAYARSLADSAHDAEDLVGDAIERTLRSAEAPLEVVPLKHWMFRTLRNLSFDELRKRRVRREYASALTRLDAEAPRGQSNLEDQVLLRRALADLQAHEREILVLVDVLGLSYSEAAALIEVPKGTVMSRLSRARRALLQRIDPAASAMTKSEQRRR